MNHVVVTLVLPSGQRRDVALPLDAPVALLTERLAQKFGLKHSKKYTFFVQGKSQRIRVWPELILGRFPLLHGMEIYLDEDPQAAERRFATVESGVAKLVSAFGQDFPLERGETIIGRSDPMQGIFPDIDLSMLDPERTVSRRHARIVYRKKHYWLEDLNSVNGTRHNGKLLAAGKPVALVPGDRIEFGRGGTVFKFQLVADEES